MWDFSIGNALKLVARTLPFVGLRLAVCFGIAAGYILAIGVGAAAGHWVCVLANDAVRATGTLLGAIIGFGIFGVLMYWLRERILYSVKVSHIAVLVPMIDGKVSAGAKPQISYAASVVRDMFGEPSSLFALDRRIKGVVATINGMARGPLSILPLPGMQRMAGTTLHVFLRVPLGFMDEIILAQVIRMHSSNPWHSGKESLVFYGRNHRLLLNNAACLAVLVYSLSVLVFLLLLLPASWGVEVIPGPWSASGYLFALLLTWSTKGAVLEPIALVCLMRVYFDALDGQEPDPEWEARLEQLSVDFRKLKARALDTVGGSGGDGNGTLAA